MVTDDEIEVLVPPRGDGDMTRRERRLVQAVFGLGLVLMALAFMLHGRPEPEPTVLDGMVERIGVVTNGPGSYQVRFMLRGTADWVTATNVFPTAEAASEAARAARRRAADGLKRGFLDGLKRGLGRDKE